MGRIYKDIVETVGNTPLVRLNKIAEGAQAEILLKCEYFNPLASVKDRIGFAMIDAAEKDGLIDKDTLIVEPTSGNTGIALAFVCAARGYKLILTMPETMSVERRALLAMLGADLVLTPGELGMKGAIDSAREILSESNKAWMPQQFENESNPEIHRQTTAKEILEDCDGKVDAIVAGVGTGGTLTGCLEVIKAKNPACLAYAVEPEDSPVISQTLNGAELKPGPHKIQGTGAGFIPDNLHIENDEGKRQLDGVITVSNEDSFTTARQLALMEGILAGISSGANVWAALQLAKKPELKGKRIVTFAPSTGERYLSTPLAAEALRKVR